MRDFVPAGTTKGRSPSGGFAISLWKPSPDHSSNCMVTQRWQVAAALSAAVTTTKQQEYAPNSQAEPSKQKRLKPSASRSSGERGLGGEGKDSHSRQWRLSMAVFLNRNKRPTAAPIEVAEAFLRKAASLALPHQSPTRFTAGEEEDDEEG